MTAQLEKAKTRRIRLNSWTLGRESYGGAADHSGRGTARSPTLCMLRAQQRTPVQEGREDG
eukprot:8171115-Pyramimonas_sp.AAC.1